MELIQNIWTRFGFRGNPFDTSALAAAAESLLPIGQAIVGREMKSPESNYGEGQTGCDNVLCDFV